MSWFSRKTIIAVSSVVYPMGEEPAKIPDMVKASMIAAHLRHQDIPTAINKCIFDGLGVRLSQAWSYAKNHYYGGLPTGLPDIPKSRPDAMLELLCKEYLEQFWAPDLITLHDYKIVNTNDYQTKFEELTAAEYDFDWAEGWTLSTTGPILTHAELTWDGPQRDFLDPTKVDKIGYTLTFHNPGGSTVVVQKWYDEGEFEGLEEVMTRIIMRYSRNGGRAVTESYEEGGQSNRLNIMLKQLAKPLSGTFPCIVIKKNNVYLNNDKFSNQPWANSPAYKTSRTYAQRMGINIDDLIHQVQQNESDDDIDYVFVQPGIRLGSPSKPVAEYLFNYFNRLRVLYPDNKPAVEAWALINDHTLNGGHRAKQSQALSCPVQSYRVYDPDAQSNTLDMAIGWRWISIETKSGTLAANYVSECGAYEQYAARHIVYRGEEDEIYETTKLYLRRRLTDTTYEEITVCGLRHENYIYKGRTIESGVYAAFNDPDSDDGSGFMIPLDYTVFITLSARERLQLSQECFHLVFNCIVIHKQAWYETDWFKTLLFFVAIVIIVLTWGTGTPAVASGYASLTAELIAIGLSATVAAAVAAIIIALIVVAINVAISYVAKIAGKWAADHWGPAWGAITQMVTAIALSYGVGQLGASFNFNIPAFGLPSTVLQIGQALLSGMAAYTEYTYVQLQDQMKQWSDQTQGKDNPLEQVNKLLQEMFPELTDLQMAAMPRPESEEEFLGRTLAGVDALTNRLFLPVNNMVELTLTPRL